MSSWPSQLPKPGQHPHAGSLCGEDGVPSGLDHIRSWNEEECDCDLHSEPTPTSLPLNLALGCGLALAASLRRRVLVQPTILSSTCG